jgi:ATP-dependent Clp protease ATP-binding subunit ClpX
MATKKDNLSCSFCGRAKKDTQVLIAGINGHICDSCIRQASVIVQEEQDQKEQKEISSNL